MKYLSQQPIPRCSDQQLAVVFEMLDHLHGEVAESGQGLSPRQRQQLIEWLREIVYTAQETLTELQQHNSQPRVCLRLLDQPALARRCTKRQA
ncbi:MAG: hypothetical protein ACOCX5_00185 [Chloroflexota bacterium]